MAKNSFFHNFLSSSNDSFEDYLPPVPHKIPTERAQKAEEVYQKQMDNYNKMLDEGLKNWPYQTVVGQDTLTWLSEDSLAKLCSKQNGEDGDYTACTFHNEPPIGEFAKSKLPIAGSRTYMSSNLPRSIWRDIANHEKDHHAVTSAKQTMMFDASHHLNQGKIPVQRNILRGAINNLNEFNDYIETTNWLQRNSLGKYLIKKRLNHEPKVRNSLLDYIRRFLIANA